MRAGQEHFVVVLLAEFFRVERQRVIVPTVFQRFGDTGVAVRVRRAGMIHDDVVNPAFLLIFGQMAARPVRVGGVLAQKFIDARPVKIQAAFPVAEKHEHRVVAVKRRVHPAGFARHVKFRMQNIQFQFRLQQRQQNNLVAAGIPKWHRTIAVVIRRMHLIVGTAKRIAFFGNQARAGERMIQRGIKKFAVVCRAAFDLDEI